MPNTKAKRPNIIFLSIDSVRYDHTSLGNYVHPTTPNLDKMQQNALSCPTTFSLGPFTQSACIQMLTSSQPFSSGGYDQGAWGRPNTVFKHFHDAGYDTTAISTLHWVNRFMGYGDGLDEECHLFVLNSLVGACMVTIKSTLSMFNQNQLDTQEMLLAVVPIIRKFFVDTSKYCDLKIKNRDDDRARYPDSLLANIRYDYKRVKKVIATHQAEFEINPENYIRNHFNPIPDTHEWVAADWKHCREPGKILSEVLFLTGNYILGLFNSVRALNRSQRFKPYVEAKEVADKVIDKMSCNNDEKPFFIWAHFMDAHLPYMSGQGRKWYKQTPDTLEHLGHSRDINPSGSNESMPKTAQEWEAYEALYDAAIYTVDSQIGRIRKAVEDAGKADETIIVVCSDHGEEFGEHGNFAHQFTFYEHNVRIPLMFHQPGLGKQTEENLMTLMDIGPTLAKMAGIPPDNNWRGVAAGSLEISNREYVVLETFYGGNCLFEYRPFYFGIRTHSHKYIWKEEVDEKDNLSPEGPELYNLAKDPEEQVNIYAEDHPLVPAFNKIIAERMRDIPEIPRNRITEAFGPDVLADDIQ